MDKLGEQPITQQTPHIKCHKGDFAEICLLPGDPLRAKYIAEKFLTQVKQVTSVRNMLGFTGWYKGKRVSVMGTGMGLPSISIYAHELVTDFGVKKLIRLGTCGAIDDSINVRDCVIAMGACTDSGINRQRFGGNDYAAIPDYKLMQNLVTSTKAKGKEPKVGNIFSADLFYMPKFKESIELLAKFKILGIEMEAAGLFSLAAELGVQAAAICTVSDHIIKKTQLSSDERQTSLNEMIEIVLESTLLDS